MASTDSLSAPNRRRASVFLLSAIAALALVAAGAWLFWPRRPTEVAQPATAPPAPDPRLTFATRYRNVRPEVAYVGAERCAPCHRGIAAQYLQHPMGQSMAALADGKDWAIFAPRPWKPFDADGLHYRIEARDGALWHVESKR